MSRPQRQTASFWISYSDLATGLLLIFMIMAAVTMNQQAQVRVELEDDQEELDRIQEEINNLLGRRNLLATRLEAASAQANQELRQQGLTESDVFVYVPDDQSVEVRLDGTDVVWFQPGGAKLAREAFPQLRAFFVALYEQIMCTGDDPIDAMALCEPDTVRVPSFLASIEISGHTDPVTMAAGEPMWSWGAFNGTSSRGRGDGNLRLSQARAKAIVDAIQTFYERDRQSNAANAITDDRYPWRPFVALVHTTGRGWMASYCEDPNNGRDRVLQAADFLKDEPCVISPQDRDRLYRRSRRVSFSFRLDDKAILQRLQDLAKAVEGLGQAKRVGS